MCQATSSGELGFGKCSVYPQAVNLFGDREPGGHCILQWARPPGTGQASSSQTEVKCSVDQSEKEGALV